ncbi:hypothetical protein EMIT0347P_70301 [Pseudomonas sp. IT-347P]
MRNLLLRFYDTFLPLRIIQPAQPSFYLFSQARIVLQLCQVRPCLLAKLFELRLLVGHLLLHLVVDRLLVTEYAAARHGCRFRRGRGGRLQRRRWLAWRWLRIEVRDTLSIDPFVDLSGRAPRTEADQQSKEERSHADSLAKLRN